EREIADAILARTRSRPIVALDGPIRTTFWKLRGSRVVVSPDTGPLHAAVAMNRPVIGLYGYSDPRRTGPYKRFQDLLVDHYRADPETPIGRSTHRGRMDGITAVEVLDKIRLALQRYR
ncbi:MAG: glycosyltransferase family 9 protein, partial [Thermoanaerobaculia bacterium]